ncbi:uncharacterized protein LOC113485305 [Athene cunicularia]|uniref:uncharacterized protein LOC113485305 n=1 Tax=Athene cunicularia TaxID=194338 RepID=UPI000EF74CBA|nr:uncharacterized protein LOC113485305 [Athene cunicularia]
MDAGEAEQDVCVRAAMGLHQAAGLGESWAGSCEDPLQLLFSGKEVQDSCLTVDGIFHLDAGQEKVLELARPQLALVPLGYSVSLLLWDPHGPGTQLPFQSIVWQVIDTIFQELEALGGDTQSLQTVSLVQVCAHDKAWDLLRPDGRALQVMDVVPLGLMVEGATEIAVPDAQAAISVYAWGLGAIPALFEGCAQQPLADGRLATQGAGSLFTLTVERELEGGRHQCSALRILVSLGATGPCPRPAPAVAQPVPDAGCLPWVIEQLLEGNSLTFLLLCVTLPDTSREEILAALGLAEQVKGLAKSISATFWDPVQEVAARRREIRGLRMELLARAGLPEQKTAVARLQTALRELQVLKSQRWENKQAAAEVPRTSQMHKPGVQDWISAAPAQPPGTQTPLSGASLEPAGPERGDRPHSWVADMWARSIASHRLGASKSSQGGDSQAPASTGQGLLEEPLPSDVPQPWPLTGADTMLQDQQHLAGEQREALDRQHRVQLQEALRNAAELAEPNQRLRDATTQTP